MNGTCAAAACLLASVFIAASGRLPLFGAKPHTIRVWVPGGQGETLSPIPIDTVAKRSGAVLSGGGFNKRLSLSLSLDPQTAES